MKKVAICLVLSLIAVAYSQSTWQSWNEEARKPDYADTFFKPPIPRGFYRNTGTSSFPINTFMRNQYMYFHQKSSSLAIFCAPRSYLVNSTHCLRDPKYWPVSHNPPYCTPNVLGNIRTDIIYSVLVQRPVCSPLSASNSQTDCCYRTNFQESDLNKSQDVFNIVNPAGSTDLFDKESGK